MDSAVAFQQHCREDREGDAPHLPGWSVENWRSLFARTQPVSLASGEVLIRRGDLDRALYFVIAGALEVTARAGRGDALGKLFREQPGSVLGEVSLFDGRPRTANVWATEPSTLLRLDLEALHAFTTEHPALGRDLLFALGRVLALRLRRGEQRGFAGG